MLSVQALSVGSEEPLRLLQQGRVGSDLNFTKVLQQQGEEPTSGTEVGWRQDRCNGHCVYWYKVVAACVIYYVGTLLLNSLNFRNLTGTVAQMHKNIRMRMFRAASHTVSYMTLEKSTFITGGRRKYWCTHAVRSSHAAFVTEAVGLCTV